MDDDPADEGMMTPESQAILRHWRDAVPHDRLAHLVKNSMRGLSRALHVRLMEHAVSYGHWTFLRVLWERDGLTQRQLSEQAGLQEPTTYAALTAMERLGHITRIRDPENRRVVKVFLTAQGLSLRDKLIPLAEEVNHIAVQGVSAEDLAATRRTLLAIIANLEDDEAATPASRRFPSTRALSHLLADEDRVESEGAETEGAMPAPPRKAPIRRP